LNSIDDHREVVVRAQASGSVHGLLLSEGINGEPCPGWRRRFFTAPSLIGLEFTSSYGVRLTEEQERLNREFLSRLHKLRSAGRLKNYAVTLKGVVVKESWPLIFRQSDGGYHGFGMGPYGALAAVFVIKSVLEEGN
jgi:hypothetical protein